MELFDLGAILAIGGGGVAAGWLVAALTQLIKNVLPEEMQTGRGILLIVYAISALFALAAITAASPESKPGDPLGLAVLGLLVWQGITQSAIGANQLTRKVQRIASKSTYEHGQDPPRD